MQGEPGSGVPLAFFVADNSKKSNYSQVRQDDIMCVEPKERSLSP